ncbi:MAG: CxxC-x17-CxxC domain-containing protein [Dehalococcoidia bacterium]
MAFEDKTLVCRSCGKEFTFTAGEQEFYSSRGFQEPSHCPECRAARRRERSGDRGPRVMHKAICASCGAECEVPFEPRGDRPVYCSECFASIRNNQ